MGLLDGLFGGGGGSTSSEVTSTLKGGLTSTIQGGASPVAFDLGLNDVNADIDLAMGLDNVNVTSTTQGGTKPVGLEVGGGSKPVGVEIGGGALPVATTSAIDFAVTQPIVSDITSKLDSRVDVEPLQVDLCVDVGLSKLPRASIHQPYKSHFGVAVLGTELVGFDWIGHSNVVIDELPDAGPRVIDHGVQQRQVTRGRRGPRQHPVDQRGPGLRIRLD